MNTEKFWKLIIKWVLIVVVVVALLRVVIWKVGQFVRDGIFIPELGIGLALILSTALVFYFRKNKQPNKKLVLWALLGVLVLILVVYIANYTTRSSSAAKGVHIAVIEVRNTTVAVAPDADYILGLIRPMYWDLENRIDFTVVYKSLMNATKSIVLKSKNEAPELDRYKYVHAYKEEAKFITANLHSKVMQVRKNIESNSTELLCTLASTLKDVSEYDAEQKIILVYGDIDNANFNGNLQTSTAQEIKQQIISGKCTTPFGGFSSDIQVIFIAPTSETYTLWLEVYQSLLDESNIHLTYQTGHYVENEYSFD